MKQIKKTGIATALGAVVIGSLSHVAVASEAGNFGMQTLESGYMQFAEGKCGEGKCGGDKAKKEGKCGEGKCGGDKAHKEGKCGEGKCGGDKAHKEGKCGEGKCGG
uniref:HvfA family oxazolone/thioamide-modified RiPP metallophore n=1 Tax=Lacimicrobium sp. SS2-24 TaxID=2005569 RepID=UPI000B4A5DFD